MRIIGLIMLIAAAFTSAQTRIMDIHMKDGTTDSIYCSRMDADVGVTFSKTKMEVGVVDTFDGIPYRSVLWFCTGQIDSITFDSIASPPPAGFNKSPAPNQRVSNTIPRPISQRAPAHDMSRAIERKR
jgi:hypothetical protein